MKIDGKPIFYRSWHQCGVEKVEHLLDDSGNNFRTYETLLIDTQSKLTLQHTMAFYAQLEANGNFRYLPRKNKLHGETGSIVKRTFLTLPCIRSSSTINSNHQVMKHELSVME